MNIIHIEDIDIPEFWINYFGCSYPNAYDEKTDVSVTDLLLERCTLEIERWWAAFTGYRPGVLDETDGYIDDPTTLEARLPTGNILRIEFHPGDTLYFINGEEVGSTGPHWKLQTIAFDEIEQLLAFENGRQLFLLLLPLAYITPENVQTACKTIQTQVQFYFPEWLSAGISNCIAAGASEPCR